MFQLCESITEWNRAQNLHLTSKQFVDKALNVLQLPSLFEGSLGDLFQTVNIHNPFIQVNCKMPTNEVKQYSFGSVKELHVAQDELVSVNAK